MRNIEFQNTGSVNLEVLDAEIRAAFGADKIAGLSSDGDGGIVVHVLDDSLSEKEARTTAADVLKAHNASAKTARQQQVEATRQTLVDFVAAPDVSKERAMTTAELTARIAEHEKILKLLLGAREEQD